jgi:flagellar motor switch/type III secretory pathway protein FliN
LTNQIGADQLLLELARCEHQLKLWLSRSAANAERFATDPVSAMRAAELGLPEDILQELALVLGSLKEKLADAA